MAMHPELNTPTRVLPEDTAAAQAEFEAADLAWNAAKDALLSARLRQGEFTGRARRVSYAGVNVDHSNDDEARRRGRQHDELVEFLGNELGEAEQHLDTVRNRYRYLQARDQQCRVAAAFAEQQRLRDERTELVEAAKVERRSSLRDRFGRTA